MSDFVFNISKGRVAEFYNRVQSNDPANSALIVVPVDRGAASDATLKDCATLSAVLAAGVTERSTGNWARKTLTDADLSALTVDNSNDRMPCDFGDQSWTSVSGSATTDVVICYDADTTSGTDANIIPLTCHAFAVTPDGSSVTMGVTDFFRAS